MPGLFHRLHVLMARKGIPSEETKTPQEQDLGDDFSTTLIHLLMQYSLGTYYVP